MDEVNWEKTMMQGQSLANHDWFPRPKLEIPNIEPATPRRQGTSSQSPRGIYDFPISPQSPGEGMLQSPPIKPTLVKPIPRPMWIVQEDYIDLIPKCTQFNPKNNQAIHSFGDCNANYCSSNTNNSNTININNESFGHGSYLLPSLNIGDNVLVRCNKTKWLAGQVRRTLSNSVKIWIGEAETMVNVPVELFSTHLARMECGTPCSSPKDCYDSTLRQNHSQYIKTQVQCVRPAHLSHRRLFQVSSPHGSNTNSSPQMNQSQCQRSTLSNPRTNYEGHCHSFTPTNVANPSNLSEHIAYMEKKGTFPPKHPPNSQEAMLDGHGGFVDKQAQLYNTWRLHMAQNNMQGNRSTYPRPSTLPMLNVNLCNEGTPRSNSPCVNGRSYSTYHHDNRASPREGQNAAHNINQETATMHASSPQEATRSPLFKPDYEQFVAPQMVTKGTMTSAAENNVKSPRRPPTPSQLLAKPMTSLEGRSPKRPPTPAPTRSKDMGDDAIQLLTKGMMDLGDGRSPKRPPTPSRSKGKETCEDRTCPSWAKGTDFRHLSESRQGTSLERSVSLDSFQPPSFPGLVDARSPGARPPRNATTEPVWVTVIDNGNGTRKST